ncbi:tectonic-1 [Nerophis lumbriciformis]|uniref:tectonic-1 n=1 Tax=Nerophis lumbriciformis TaxID=546530 RepID=UPI003BAC6823
MAGCVAILWLLLFIFFTAVASNENTTAYNFNLTTVFSENETFYNLTSNVTETTTVPDAQVGESVTSVGGSDPLAVSGRLPTPVTDVGSVCSCDEHENLCDINCCCDTECHKDVALFTACSLPTISGNKHLCSHDSASYSLQYTVDGYSQLRSSVHKDTYYQTFCIQSQNRVDGFSFLAPVLPVDTNFDLLFKQFKRFVFSSQDDSAQISTAVTDNFYQYGDVIVSAKEDGQRGIFWLPASSITVDCVDHSPAAFLVDMRSRCSRRVDLEKDCISLPALKADTYTKISLFAHKNEGAKFGWTTGFKIPVVPVETSSVVLQSLAGTQNEINLNEEEDINPHLIDQNVCANVVLKVAYMVTYSAAGQVVKAAVQLLLAHLHATSLSLEQEFTLTFLQEKNENMAYQNSGNPGYLKGQPLLSGRATSEGIVRNLGDTLSIPQSSSHHNCLSSPQQRSPVLFGVESTSGCTLRLEDATNCSLVSQIILDVLQGQNYPQFVAAFGNSPLENALDWVPIQHTYHLKDSQVCSIPLSLDLQIEWTKYGLLLNPQAQIVSVKQVIQTKSSSLVLMNRGNSVVLIRSSVSFFEVSASALPGYRATPTINAQLPIDFFFPFV